MKRLSLFFFVLLVLWIIIATYWYVCKIRNDCGRAPEASLAEPTDTLQAAYDAAEPVASPEKDPVALAADYLDGVGTKTYYFDFASAELKTDEGDTAYLSALRLYLKNRSEASVTIEGHADNRGSAAANDRFAKLRAEAVMQYLTGNGIDENRIRTISRSDTEPAASNDSEDGRKLNRRAEITIN
ncbi:MAG: OmpA family protein [Bacteroidales bacterium]|nr:OmpA family protein [Bacteroidales bacterium]